MNEPRTYGQKDIQRYVQQQMSPQEMHEFEKALMDDPFLADAIEGFSTSDPVLAAAHLEAIQHKLEGDKEQPKVVLMPVQKTGWWKAVAIVLVIIIGGGLFYALLNKRDRDLPVAKQEVRKQPGIRQQPDSVGPVDKPLVRNEALLPKEISRRPKVNSTPLINQSPETALSAAEKDTPLALSSAAQPTINEMLIPMRPDAALQKQEKAGRMMASRLPEQNIFKGQVTDEAGDALPFAIVKVSDSNIGTVTDRDGKFTLRAPDSVVQAKIWASGYDSTTATLKSNLSINNISLVEKGLSLGDIVATEYAKKSSSKGFELQRKRLVQAEPEGGWQHFEQYLRRSVDSLRNVDKTLPADKNIELEFSINKQGEPVDINTLKEADKRAADKAKQLLMRGPKWKKAQNEGKVKVVISF